MAWRKLTHLLESYAPSSVQRSWRNRLAWQYVRALDRAETLEEKVAVATGKTYFHSNQRRTEILSLLSELYTLRPRTVCEIGCDRGGTLSLFAQVADPEALIISIDPVHQSDRTHAFQLFARHQQRIIRIAGDSHAPATQQALREALQGRPLDFLFVDGDHSYDGVAQDYQMYAPLLRDGGLLAFHDIVPDAATRSAGVDSSRSYVGGVPMFYQDVLRHRHATQTWIENPQQDGFGIALVRWSDASRRNVTVGSRPTTVTDATDSLRRAA